MSLLYIAADTLQKTFILEKMGQLQGNIIDNFTSWLGRVSCDPALRKEIELPQGVQRAYSPEDLCEKVFPAASMAGIDPHSDFFASRAILAVRNADLSSFNTSCLSGCQESNGPIFQPKKPTLDLMQTDMSYILVNFYRV